MDLGVSWFDLRLTDSGRSRGRTWWLGYCGGVGGREGDGSLEMGMECVCVLMSCGSVVDGTTVTGEPISSLVHRYGKTSMHLLLVK